MATERGAFALEADSSDRGRPLLWVLFAICWAVDLLTTLRFFSVPALTETSPVTRGLHWLLGIPGVVLAATGYAAIVVLFVRLLPAPLDRAALGIATVLYAAFALHNLSLLVWGVSLIGLYALCCWGGFLTLLFTDRFG